MQLSFYGFLPFFHFCNFTFCIFMLIAIILSVTFYVLLVHLFCFNFYISVFLSYVKLCTYIFNVL